MLAAAHKRTPSSYMPLADTHPACTPANDHHYPHAHHPAYARAPGSTLYEEYHPFGTTSYAANDSGIEVSAKRYRYIGKERDEETGLYHCGARYLAAWLGRWTAADPIGLGDGVNRYAYARGNPVRLVDPAGTRAADPSTVLGELAVKQATLLSEIAFASARGHDVDALNEELETVNEEIAEEQASLARDSDVSGGTPSDLGNLNEDVNLSVANDGGLMAA